MESIIRDKIMTHMTDNAMFSKAQHGFRPGRSCVTQLLEVIESWTRILDAGGVVDAIYFDFAKAFDTVPMERLLLKCYAHGIQGSMLTWIRSFLNRNVTSGSGEWCRLKLVTSYKWDTARQCIRATSVSAIHQ